MPYFEAGIDIPKELPYQKKKTAPKLKMMIGSVGSRRGSNADHSHDNASIGASSVSSNARATQGNAIVSVGEKHSKMNLWSKKETEFFQNLRKDFRILSNKKSKETFDVVDE